MSHDFYKNPDVAFFAETNFRNSRQKFGIKTVDRRRHMYLIGKTGMGKSTAIENLVLGDILGGRGVALVDPHGDAVEKILKYIPESRMDDVVYLNPGDAAFPIAFNVLESPNPEQKHLVGSGVLGVFKKLWADSWGPRLEYLLRNSILTLLDNPGSSLLGVTRVLTDKSYRRLMVENVQDPIVKSFWLNEFNKYPDKFQAEAVNPIQNKVGQFLSLAMIRNIIGQPKSSFNIEDIMNNKKILLMNLSKGRIGEDASMLLGSMMITKIQLAAMNRVQIQEEDRKDFYLYVDEFQNFATDSFAGILSEARKYRLCLILAHQYIGQLSEEVRDAIFGNVGTLVTFRVGAEDAQFLAKEFEPVFTEFDLVNLTKFTAYLRLMIDGVASDPFSANTLPPLNIEETQLENKIIDLSRQKFARPVAEVEKEIYEWTRIAQLEESEQQSEKSKQDNQANKKSAAKIPIINLEEYPFEAECDVAGCGKKTRLKFEPDGKRPIYCRDCLKKARAGIITPSLLKKKSNNNQSKASNPKQAENIPKPVQTTISKTIEPTPSNTPSKISLAEVNQQKTVPFNQPDSNNKPDSIPPNKQATQLDPNQTIKL